MTRKVNFNEIITVKAIPTHRDYSSKEWSSVWYTVVDYRCFNLSTKLEHVNSQMTYGCCRPANLYETLTRKVIEESQSDILLPSRDKIKRTRLARNRTGLRGEFPLRRSAMTHYDVSDSQPKRPSRRLSYC